AKSGLILSEDAPQVAKMLLAQISALVQDREDRKNHTKTLHAKSGLILSEDAPQVAKMLVAQISAVRDREDRKSHTKTPSVFDDTMGGFVYIERFHTGPEKRNRGVVSYGVGEAVKRGEGLSAAAPQSLPLSLLSVSWICVLRTII
ncbi:hypothetical protein J6590_107044, partial [Homalodisca vitripennis]